MDRRDVDVTMRKAFDVWSKVTNLKFEEKTSGKAHIEIRCPHLFIISHRDQAPKVDKSPHRDQISTVYQSFIKRSGAVANQSFHIPKAKHRHTEI
jgi:hypothetical protein